MMWRIVLAVSLTGSGFVYRQVPAITQQDAELSCKVVASAKAVKVGGGFFEYTAPADASKTGLVLLIELAYPPALTSVSSSAFAVKYGAVAADHTSPSIGFDAIPRADDVLDKDITWILHVDSTYTIPLKDPGFDGKIGSEQMRMLFEVPAGLDTATLLYRGRACGPPITIR
jgi:hypothetical protein